jgi:hypothetical protein
MGWVAAVDGGIISIVLLRASQTNQRLFPISSRRIGFGKRLLGVMA